MNSGGSSGDAWSETVEDLVDSGDDDGAIAILENVISKLQILDGPGKPVDPQLATALTDLADLYYSRGFSLKADELRSRSLALRARRSNMDPEPAVVEKKVEVGEGAEVPSSSNDKEGDDDDWETIADRGDEPQLVVQNDRVVMPTSSRDKEMVGTPKRRGRGSFMYKTSSLYSEQADDRRNLVEDESGESHSCRSGSDSMGNKYKKFGTAHVLVLYELSPNTRTMDLEKIYEKYRDGKVAIRWVNDTTALAVFQTPALAREAQSTIRCTFRVRALREDDTELITKDLEPPYPRPKTSTSTAERLIAHGMGIKPFKKLGSNEVRKQEEERKNRILARHALRDNAWGSDDP